MAATAQQSGPARPTDRRPTRSARLSIDTIRGLAMDAVQKANAGHPGTAMALAPLAYTLFKRFLRANPDDPEWPDRDRFVLSAGHACMLQYSLLHLTRLRPRPRGPEAVPPVGLAHARATPSAGTRPASRSRPARSGQGFANAVGMAIAERFLAERFNRPGQRDRRPPHLRDLLRRRHDGGRQPGSGLDRRPLRARQADRLLRRQPHHDRRHHRRSPSTARTTLARMEADGWHVQRVEDSEDVEALEAALTRGARGSRAPVVHRDPLAHRLPGAERGRHRQVARRGARRGGGARAPRR